MSLLGTYLWKEWREQRQALGFLALGLTVVTAILAALLPRESWSWAGAYESVVGTCLGAALLTVGSDLLPRDLRREPRQFLERAPAGLRAAFSGKLIFFVALLLAAGVFGIHLASAAAVIRTGGLPNGLLAMEQVPLIAAAVVLWVFAVSAWVSTSAMTVPTTLILLTVFSWPWWFHGPGLAPLELGSTSSDILIAVIAVGGLVTACWSFVVGAARSHRRFVVALGGLGVAVLFFLPSWAMAGARYLEWKNSGFYIWDAQVGLGGRYAFVSLGRLDPSQPGRPPEENSRFTALVLDLEDGSWSLAGEIDESAFVPDREFSSWQSFLGRDACPRFNVHHIGSAEQYDVYDSLSGKTIDRNALGNHEWPGPFPADFDLEGPYRRFHVYWAGLGQRLSATYRNAPWRMIQRNPAGDLIVDLSALTSDGGEPRISSAFILPAGWLARENRDGSGDWTWVDPLTGECEKCESLSPEEQILGTMDDGTLLVNTSGTLSRLNPGTGERESIRVTGAGVPSALSNCLSLNHFGAPIPTDSRSVFCLEDYRTTRRRLVLLDPTTNELQLSPIEWSEQEEDVRWPLLSTDGSRAIASNFWQVFRCDLAKGTREVIFDVSGLDESDLRAGSVTR